MPYIHYGSLTPQQLTPKIPAPPKYKKKYSAAISHPIIVVILFVMWCVFMFKTVLQGSIYDKAVQSISEGTRNESYDFAPEDFDSEEEDESNISNQSRSSVRKKRLRREELHAMLATNRAKNTWQGSRSLSAMSVGPVSMATVAHRSSL
jgi:hypothetical protein